MKRKAICADLFCGAGGMSEGLREACGEADYELELVAINHWQIAIDSHSANHAYAKHLCANVQDADPKKLVPGGRLKFLLAGIECTHHSNARGGRPRNDQSRSSAWLLLKWASELYIDTIIIENVKEFRSWGPLGADLQPLKSKRGETFLAFIKTLESFGYKVEHKLLCAADYGDPTTRERLFVVGRRGANRNIVWPAPTHRPVSKDDSQGSMFAKGNRWRTAREIIEWSEKGKSIFNRKKPLAPKTIDRIAAGLRKFGGKNAEPFLVMLYGTNNARSVDLPVPTVTANGQHIGLVQPERIPSWEEWIGKSKDVGGTREEYERLYGGMDLTDAEYEVLCEPFVIGQQSGAQPRSVNEPIPTIATAGAISLIEPFILPMEGIHRGNAPRSIEDPVPTDPAPRGTEGRRAHSVDEPLKTVTTEPSKALVEPFVVKYYGTGVARPVDAPLDTVTGNDRFGLVDPFLIQYNGKSESHPVDEPVNTIPTRDRFGLVTTEHGTFRLDIRFRMLTNRELARAQCLPDSYILKGKKTEVTKQIGNMVPVNLAKAVIAAQLNG
jgi:DNA (cytosine-5)-methyltransferase 1